MTYCLVDARSLLSDVRLLCRSGVRGEGTGRGNSEWDSECSSCCGLPAWAVIYYRECHGEWMIWKGNAEETLRAAGPSHSPFPVVYFLVVSSSVQIVFIIKKKNKPNMTHSIGAAPQRSEVTPPFVSHYVMDEKHDGLKLHSLNEMILYTGIIEKKMWQQDTFVFLKHAIRNVNYLLVLCDSSDALFFPFKN